MSLKKSYKSDYEDGNNYDDEEDEDEDNGDLVKLKTEEELKFQFEDNMVKKHE